MATDPRVRATGHRRTFAHRHASTASGTSHQSWSATVAKAIAKGTTTSASQRHARLNVRVRASSGRSKEDNSPIAAANDRAGHGGPYRVRGFSCLGTHSGFSSREHRDSSSFAPRARFRRASRKRGRSTATKTSNSSPLHHRIAKKAKRDWRGSHLA